MSSIVAMKQSMNGVETKIKQDNISLKFKSLRDCFVSELGWCFGSRVTSQNEVEVVCRKVFNYVRYDLKEIAFPSSLPDPPHLKKRPELTCKERYLVLKEASRLYAASWVRDIGPELRPNDYRTKEEDGDMFNAEKCVPKEREPSTFEDLAVAARGGMETSKPALQRVYMTRASAYRDALRSYIEGHQEGIKQVMEKKENGNSQRGEDAHAPKSPTCPLTIHVSNKENPFFISNEHKAYQES